jgi:hypothetical protein
MFESGPVYVPTGATEPVEVQVAGLDNLPLLGKTSIKLCVRRISDNTYLDWTDNTFKVGSSVVQMLLALVEVSPTYSPGVYELDTSPHVKGLNTAVLTNASVGDVYDVTVVQDGEYDAPGLPVGFEIKLGAPFADKLEGLPGNVAAAVWDEGQLAHVIAGSFGNAVRRILALQKENYFIDEMTYNSRGLLLGGRIRIFPDKTTALAATAGGASEGEVGVYSFTTTEVPGHIERAATARSVRDA